MKKSIKALLIACLVLLNFTLPISNAAETVKEHRVIGSFDKIHIVDVGKIILSQGEKEELYVEVDENKLNYIKTTVRNGTLTLDYKPKSILRHFRPPSPLNYYLTIVSIRDIEISGSASVEADSLQIDELDIEIDGSGKIDIDDLQANKLYTDISGSGDFDLAGQVNRQKIRVSGSGKYRAIDLQSNEAEIKISGSGKVSVSTRDALALKISGSGTVEYAGNPKITTDISGSGHLVSLD